MSAYILFVAGLRTRSPDEPAWAEEWLSLHEQRGVHRTIPLRVTDDLGPILCRLPSGVLLDRAGAVVATARLR